MAYRHEVCLLTEKPSKATYNKLVTNRPRQCQSSRSQLRHPPRKSNRLSAPAALDATNSARIAMSRIEGIAGDLSFNKTSETELWRGTSTQAMPLN